MKRTINKLSLAILLLISLSCSKQPTENPVSTNDLSSSIIDPEYQADLIAYKASDHHLSMGYYSVVGEQIMEIPDSVDIVDVWGNGIVNDTAASLSFLRLAQTLKGTKFVQCNWPPNVNETAEYYESWVRRMYERDIVANGMDGMDLDMETGLLNRMSAANRIVFMEAVTRYFGKTATVTVPRTGLKPLLVFGTDGSIGTSLLNEFAESVDYVVFQAYTDANNYWWGDLNDLTNELSRYNAGDNAKFIAIANGETGSAWRVNNTVGGTRAQLLEYADWCRQQDAGGIGAYHQEADMNNTPPYYYTKESINIMNEAL